MSRDDSHLGQHYHVLMKLAKSESWGQGDLASTLREVTEAAAHTLGIERVNVWLYDEGRTKIRCIEHYERSAGQHSRGVEIGAADYPAYFKALDEERAIVADDAHRDPRTREFSRGYLDVHGITSMLDAPLHSGGRVIGIVCHEHVGPRRVWTAEEQRFAASLADIAALALESSERKQAEEALRVLNTELERRVQERTVQLENAVIEKERLLEELQASSVELLDRLCELEHKSKTIRSDLERAQVIQRALLPAQPPRLDGVHVDALYRPGMNVGGDLYDVALLGDGLIAVYVADAAGHGVAAAMLSVLFKQRLELYDEEGRVLDPPEVLRRVNARLAGDEVLSQGLFLTACYVLLDTRSGVLRAAAAGHPPILLRRAGGENVFLERTGPALGIMENVDFTEHRLELRAGDRLFLYTDGLTDGLESGAAEEILELLVPALTGDATQGPNRLRGLFDDAVRRAKRVNSGEGRDDVTLLVLEAAGGPSSFDNEPTEEERPRAASSALAAPNRTVWIAEGDEETHLAVHGRGTWSSCETFRRLAMAAQAAGKRLSVDLGECTYLDSAFLGTMHEVVTSDPTGATSVSRPRDAVRALFVELGLERVLASIREEASAPPCNPVPVTQDPPERESQLRLLRAHEILSELSEENRERFSAVVRELRAELGE